MPFSQDCTPAKASSRLLSSLGNIIATFGPRGPGIFLRVVSLPEMLQSRLYLLTYLAAFCQVSPLHQDRPRHAQKGSSSSSFPTVQSGREGADRAPCRGRGHIIRVNPVDHPEYQRRSVVRLESIGHDLLVSVRVRGVTMMHMCVNH